MTDWRFEVRSPLMLFGAYRTRMHTVRFTMESELGGHLTMALNREECLALSDFLLANLPKPVPMQVADTA